MSEKFSSGMENPKQTNLYQIIPLYSDWTGRTFIVSYALYSDGAGRTFIVQWKKCQNLYRILTLYSDGADRTFIVSYPCTVMEQGEFFSCSEWSVRTFI